MALSKANFPNLISLDLGSNKIRYEEADALSQAYSIQLKQLRLSYNEL
jgi:hypothetical protein